MSPSLNHVKVDTMCLQVELSWVPNRKSDMYKQFLWASSSSIFFNYLLTALEVQSFGCCEVQPNISTEDISLLSIMALDVMSEQPTMSDELSRAVRESSSQQTHRACYVC